MKSRNVFPGQNMAQLCVWLAMICLFLCVQRGAFCQSDSSKESDGKEMVARLRLALEKNDMDQVSKLGDDLQAIGNMALPAIREALPKCDETEAVHLVGVLTGIGGSEATQFLVQLVCQPSNQKVASQALHVIGNRPIDFALTADQLECLAGVISKADILKAAAVSRVLSRCERNDRKQVIRPILERFIKEIGTPTELAPMHGAYTSPRVYVLNLFLLAFSNLGGEAVRDLETALDKAATPDIRKWLVLALGMCGNSSKGEEIRRLVENDPDIYFRSVAVRAYARSIGEKAVPVLKVLLNDTAESEYDRLPDGTPVYPIRLAARDELARLGQPAIRRDSHGVSP